MSVIRQEKIREAWIFACAAHGAIGHRRKHVDEPYFNHLTRVAEAVSLTPKFRWQTICAAYLHDVLEDTKVDRHTLRMVFGDEIAAIVQELTKPEKSAGNRRERHNIYLNQIRTASFLDTKLIKLADIADNAVSIAKHDPEFAKVYLPEVEQISEAIEECDWTLVQRAQREVRKAWKTFEMVS